LSVIDKKAMRKIAAAVAYISVCFALVQAPFNHVHAAGAADRHMAETHAGGLALHIHVGSPDSGMESLGASARALAWFRFEVQPPVHLDVDLDVTLLDAPARAPQARPRWVAEPVQRLHDPPESRPVSPRAPPSC
jgi:hypothetical protein